MMDLPLTRPTLDTEKNHTAKKIKIISRGKSENNINSNKVLANKSKYSTFNVTNGNYNKIRNVVTDSYNRYNYKIKNTIIYNMPEKLISTGQDNRGALASIFSQTGTRTHIFTGFVNAIKYNKKKTVKKRVTSCNIFWNGTIYVSNHINVFENFDDLEVGDFVSFKGELRMYTRDKNKYEYNSDDMGIGIVEIYNITKPNLNITIHKELPLEDTVYDISNTPKDILYDFYQKQITRIRLAVENEPLYNPNMYLSILQSVYYEETNDYNMVKNMLNIEMNYLTVRYVRMACITRYLVYDCKIHSPYIIYTILCYLSLSRENIPTSNKIFYYNVNNFSINNFNTFNIDIDELNQSASVCISNYISSEMKTLYDAYNNI